MEKRMEMVLGGHEGMMTMMMMMMMRKVASNPRSPKMPPESPNVVTMMPDGGRSPAREGDKGDLPRPPEVTQNGRKRNIKRWTEVPGGEGGRRGCLEMATCRDGR